MTRDPFKIDGPTALQVSGGRTSAYMLWLVLQSNGGIPDGCVVCFENTGKEEEATLRFVKACAEAWAVDIAWLEYRAPLESGQRWIRVDFEAASREGEPFEALIRARNFLPNPIARFCTTELKIRTSHRYLRSLGWTEWEQMIGIRADEQRRVAKMRSGRGHSETPDETTRLPLADAGVTLADVDAFWRAQPFRLELPTNAQGRTTAGNCDLCFLKPPAQRLSLIRERPERAVWWARMEALVQSTGKFQGDGARFKKNEPGYAELARFAEQQGEMFDTNEEALACFCGD